MIPQYIVDIIGGCVAKTSTKMLAQLQAIDDNITGVNYQHGHPNEIIETLMQLDNSGTERYKKYPLIALFEDIPEDIGKTLGIDSEPTLHLAIINATKQEYKSDERYTNNFKPILDPIYYEFLNQVQLSGKFMIKGDQIPHRRIRRLFWGQKGFGDTFGVKTVNVFNDYVDCIELQNLQLLLYPQNC